MRSFFKRFLIVCYCTAILLNYDLCSMENRVGLTLPCHWDQKIVEGILSHGVGIDGIPVTEVYGVLSHGGPVGHGRSRHSVPSVSEENAIEFRELLSKRNLGFTYLLNAPFI